MNKKMILATVLSVCLLFCLCACSNHQDNGDGAVTTTTAATTTTTTAAVENSNVTYTVKVQDETGAPVVGVMVQICKESCLPSITDANGVATWTVAEDDYKVSFADANISANYIVEENYYFDNGSREMTSVVTSVNGVVLYNDIEFEW